MWRVDFPTGATEASFIIPIVQDNITEPLEAFSLKIVIESPFNQTVSVVEPSRQTVLITGTYIYAIILYIKPYQSLCTLSVSGAL